MVALSEGVSLDVEVSEGVSDEEGVKEDDGELLVVGQAPAGSQRSNW